MKPKKWMGGVTVLLVLVGGSRWISTRRPVGFLPPHSVKLASVTAWEDLPYRPMLFVHKTYFWTIGEEIVHLERHANGPTEVVRDHLTPLHTLQRDSDTPLPLPPRATFLQPTYDGAGLLYATSNPNHIHDPDLHLLAMDGKSDRLLPALWMMNLVWMPDGKHWLISRADRDFLNSLDGTRFRELDIKSLSSSPPYIMGMNAQSHAISLFGNDMFTAPDDTSINVGSNYPTVQFFEFDPAAPTHKIR